LLRVPSRCGRAEPLAKLIDRRLGASFRFGTSPAIPRSPVIPPLQGFRLAGSEYVPITPIAGRLPSQVVGLHLERDGKKLRLFDPTTGERLVTRLEARETAEATARRLAEENECLRREIEALRGR
jgi:hypothetical protein